MLRALPAEFYPMERFATIERELELHRHELERQRRGGRHRCPDGSSERDAAERVYGEAPMPARLTMRWG